MTVGLSGKQVTYDYNNRPVSVQFAGQTTGYTYGPDGARQGKTVGASETFYAGMAEIRDFGTAQESIILQPHADFRITDAGGAGAAVSYLHRDHLSSVRLITNAAGQGEQSVNEMLGCVWKSESWATGNVGFGQNNPNRNSLSILVSMKSYSLAQKFPFSG